KPEVAVAFVSRDVAEVSHVNDGFAVGRNLWIRGVLEVEKIGQFQDLCGHSSDKTGVEQHKEEYKSEAYGHRNNGAWLGGRFPSIQKVGNGSNVPKHRCLESISPAHRRPQCQKNQSSRAFHRPLLSTTSALREDLVRAQVPAARL